MRSLCAAVVFLLLGSLAVAQSHNKRLILKDGSYQSILEYKVEGDRVHFHSAERYDWEDLPNELVDWDATNKYNADPVKNDRSRTDRESAEAEAIEDAKSETDAPTVAPRLRLPDSQVGGVYLLDDFHGTPELVEIVQSGADVSKNTGKNVLRAAVNPFGSAKQSFELAGVQARVQSHTAQPTIYLLIQSDVKAVDLNTRYRIVHAIPNPQKNVRNIGTLNVKLTGKTSETERFLPATAAHVNDGPWIKITPNAPLAPGEYAVAEMLGEGQMNLYVWDFGVNAAAPENINPTKPLPAKP